MRRLALFLLLSCPPLFAAPAPPVRQRPAVSPAGLWLLEHYGDEHFLELRAGGPSFRFAKQKWWVGRWRRQAPRWYGDDPALVIEDWHLGGDAPAEYELRVPLLGDTMTPVPYYGTKLTRLGR